MPANWERINAGQLDRQINIVLEVETQDANGGSVKTQQVIAQNVPARYRPLKGIEREYGAVGASFATVEFLVRYMPTIPISPKYTIIYEGDMFDIYEVIPNVNRSGIAIQAKSRDIRDGNAQS